jgi:hypothetical protein
MNVASSAFADIQALALVRRLQVGQKDRPVDVAAYSSAATAFEDERDGQGGFATPVERIETV